MLTKKNTKKSTKKIVKKNVKKKMKYIKENVLTWIVLTNDPPPTKPLYYTIMVYLNEVQQKENEVQQGENEEEGQEENKVQQEDDKEEGQKENEVQQEAFNKAEHDELEKLTKSLCINLLNETYQRYASKSLPEEYLNDIKSKCADLHSHFNDYLTLTLYEMINELFDEFKQFQFE